MPHVQQLYDKLKDRPGIQVITFNLDDNPGMVEPFMKQNHYTFPAVPGKAVIESVMPAWSIPQNWIIDATAVVRQTQGGFTRDEKWVEKMIEAVEQASSGPPAVR